MTDRKILDEQAALMKVFIANRQKFPIEELARYAGRWIAWAPDGASILASSAISELDLYDQLDRMGAPAGDCCVDYMGEEEGLPDVPRIQDSNGQSSLRSN